MITLKKADLFTRGKKEKMNIDLINKQTNNVRGVGRNILAILRKKVQKKGGGNSKTDEGGDWKAVKRELKDRMAKTNSVTK